MREIKGIVISFKAWHLFLVRFLLLHLLLIWLFPLWNYSGKDWIGSEKGSPNSPSPLPLLYNSPKTLALLVPPLSSLPSHQPTLSAGV
jgi:hypothetical protein